MMKKCIFLTLLLVTVFTTAQEKITKKIGNFTTVKAYNGIELELIKANEQQLEITGSKANKVKIKNINGTLKLSLKFPEISADGHAIVKLFYNKNLQVIDANEGATITGKNIKQEKLEVRSQEKAFINLVVDVQELEVKTSTGGIIKLTGSTNNQTVDLDLYGMYHGYKMKVSNKSKVFAGTGAKAEVNSGKVLTAKVSFGGTIFYKGNPETIKDKKVAGGVIEKKD